MKYSIPEQNIEALEKKLARIQRKAAKYGCPITCKRTGEHFETLMDEDRHEVVVRYIDIEVEGTAAVNGWEFAATLDHTEKGNVIQAVPGIEIPARFYDCGPWCEHCKTRRERRNSYIVRRLSDGEFLQVGRNCLKDYTGGLSAELVAVYESYIHEAEEASEWSGFGGWSRRYYGVDEFMTAAAETIRIYGYASSQSSRISTRTLTLILMRGAVGDLSKYEQETYEDAVSKGWNMDSKESAERAAEVRAWVLSTEDNSNYFHNLRTACAVDYADSKTMGLLASAFVAYDREQGKIKDRAEEKEKGSRSEHVGEVGKRITVKTVEARCVTSWEGIYGWTYVYKFVDDAGNVFTWKTGKGLDTDKPMTITGTVKDHTEYRGVKQTELTRCKVA